MINFWKEYRPQLVVLAIALIYVFATAPLFRGSAALYSVLLGFATIGIVALGLSVTLIAGEFDLSVGSMASVAAVLAVRLSGAGVWAAIGVTVVTCALIGALQGFLIARLRISSFVLTVATFALFAGLSWVIAGGSPVSVKDFAATSFLYERWGSVLAPDIVVALVLFAAIGLFLHWARAGREIYAIGGARPEAISKGVSVTRALTIAFGTSAGCAALAGTMASLKVGSAAPNDYGNLLLSGVAAALVGGIGIRGGAGTVGNVILGVAILSVAASGLSSAGAQGYTIQLVTGGLLLVMVLVDFAELRPTARTGRVRPAKAT